MESIDTRNAASGASVIHALQHAQQKFRIITSDEDIITRTGEQIIQACQLQLSSTAWDQNFHLMVEHVRLWAQSHSELVSLVLVDLKSDKTVFYISPRSDHFNFDLASQQADLDIHLNTRGAIGYTEVRQVPLWEIDRFVSDRALRVWPVTNLVN